MGLSAPATRSSVGLGRTGPHTVIKDPNPCQDRSMVKNSQGRLCVHRKPKQGRSSLHTHTPSRVSMALGARPLCSGSRFLLHADPRPLKPTPPCDQEEQVPTGRPRVSLLSPLNFSSFFIFNPRRFPLLSCKFSCAFKSMFSNVGHHFQEYWRFSSPSFCSKFKSPGVSLNPGFATNSWVPFSKLLNLLKP